MGRAVAAEEPEREGTGAAPRSSAFPSVHRARAFPKQVPRVGDIDSEKALREPTLASCRLYCI